MSESPPKEELFIDGEGGAVHIFPKIALAFIMKRPPSLAEATREKREVHQKLQEKAIEISNQSPGREVRVPCSHEEAGILVEALYYAANQPSKKIIDMRLKEAEDKFYLEAVGKSKKEIRKSMEETAKVVQEAYIELARAFDRASMSDDGLTVCFDKFDTLLLLVEGPKKPAELDNVPDALLIKAMRMDGCPYSEIAKILDKKKKREKASGKEAKQK